MRARRDDAGSQRKRHLDQARNPSRGLEVANVCLDRANGQWSTNRPVSAEDAPQRSHLDWIAHRCPWTVGLHVVNLEGGDISVLTRRQDHRFLSLLAGSHQVATVAPIIVDCAPLYHGVDRVTSLKRCAQRFQNHHPNPLAPYKPVRGRVAEPARTGGGDHHGAGEGYTGVGRQDQV